MPRKKKSLYKIKKEAFQRGQKSAYIHIRHAFMYMKETLETNTSMDLDHSVLILQNKGFWRKVKALHTFINFLRGKYD